MIYMLSCDIVLWILNHIHCYLIMSLFNIASYFVENVRRKLMKFQIFCHCNNSHDSKLIRAYLTNEVKSLCWKKSKIYDSGNLIRRLSVTLLHLYSVKLKDEIFPICCHSSAAISFYESQYQIFSAVINPDFFGYTRWNTVVAFILFSSFRSFIYIIFIHWRCGTYCCVVVLVVVVINGPTLLLKDKKVLLTRALCIQLFLGMFINYHVYHVSWFNSLVKRKSIFQLYF